MKFFESPYYLKEVAELEELQQQVEKCFILMNMSGGLAEREIHIEFLHTLYAMVEKEQCLLTRLRLDGSEEAVNVIDELTQRAKESGMAPHHNLQSYHYELKNNIILELKDMGEDVETPVEMD